MFLGGLEFAFAQRYPAQDHVSFVNGVPIGPARFVLLRLLQKLRGIRPGFLHFAGVERHFGEGVQVGESGTRLRCIGLGFLHLLQSLLGRFVPRTRLGIIGLQLIEVRQLGQPDRVLWLQGLRPLQKIFRDRPVVQEAKVGGVAKDGHLIGVVLDLIQPKC